MADAEFTPGPWVVDATYLSEVQTEGSKTIASCWHEHAEGRTITVTDVLMCSLEESAANARLIAAAPELLEAVYQYRNDLKFPMADDSRGRRIKMVDRLIDKVLGQ